MHRTVIEICPQAEHRRECPARFCNGGQQEVDELRPLRLFQRLREEFLKLIDDQQNWLVISRIEGCEQIEQLVWMRAELTVEILDN